MRLLIIVFVILFNKDESKDKPPEEPKMEAVGVEKRGLLQKLAKV
jgi:hypothetical protein